MDHIFNIFGVVPVVNVVSDVRGKWCQIRICFLEESLLR